MKKIKIILFLMLLVILSFSTYGQTNDQTVSKIAIEKLPKKVKKQIGEIKGFKVTKSTYVVENNKKIYTVYFKSNKSSFDIKFDEKGKIIGREEDYL